MAGRVRVRRYTRKDGTDVRPHSRSTPGKSGAGVVAIVLGLLFLVTGASGPGGASAVGGGAAGSARTSVQARDQKSLEAVVRLERKGFRISSRVTADDTDCAEHSYGQVQEFFRTHPCMALFRALIEVRDRRRNVVLMAVAWVEMPDADSAGDFKRLVDRHGSGNITELSRERGRYRDVRFTGDIYKSGRDSEIVVNAQAQPVHRGVGAAALAEIVQAAVR